MRLAMMRTMLRTRAARIVLEGLDVAPDGTVIGTVSVRENGTNFKKLLLAIPNRTGISCRFALKKLESLQPSTSRTGMTANALKAQDFTVSLTANDLAKSLRFYSEGLGFQIVDKFEMNGKVIGAMVAAGDAKLGISQDDFSKGRDRVKGVGMGLFVETTQDLEAIAKRARDTGIAPEAKVAPLPWGPKAVTVTDPDGFKLTIAEPNQTQ
jgi:uncharacterized glyoxalase superfamily protein PhnB